MRPLLALIVFAASVLACGIDASAAGPPPQYVTRSAIEKTLEDGGVTGTKHHLAVLDASCQGQGYGRAGRFHLFLCYLDTPIGLGRFHVEVTATDCSAKHLSAAACKMIRRYSWDYTAAAL